MEKSECFLTFEEARLKIEYWCSYRDRSEYETRQKLKAYNLSFDDIDQMVNHLNELRFLDDKRFVDSFVSGKFRIKRWGKQKIKAELFNKQVSKSLVEVALAALDDNDYFSTIEYLVEKKEKALQAEKNPWKKKQKVIQYLMSRGFEFEYINQVFANR